MRLAGQIDIEVKKDLKVLETKMVVEYLGTVPRKQALQLAFDADLLLLPLNKAKNAKGRLPGKLYEYLRTYNPILVLGPIDSDAAHIVELTQTGQCFEYWDVKGQTIFLNQIMAKNWKRIPDKKAIEIFSNIQQTKLIANFLDEMT